LIFIRFRIFENLSLILISIWKLGFLASTQPTGDAIALGNWLIQHLPSQTRIGEFIVSGGTTRYLKRELTELLREFSFLFFSLRIVF
jgi:hypothetical protein